MLDNKWALARFLQSHHLPVPRTWRVESEEQLSGLDLPYPVIVKPVQLENRQGVKQIDSLTAAVAHLREPHPAHRLPLLFQEYIPGTDVDLSILANHGEVVDWTIQQWVKPGTLRFIDDEAILGLGRQLAAACRFHGLAHFDLRRDDRDGSVKVLECNPRFWATLRESMWNGTNFVARGIQLATGQLAPAQQVNRQITYSFPSQTLATCLKGDFSGLRGLNTESWQGTWQAFSDPLTWLHKVRSQL
ncbi:MAG TPA: ATP-grasp domain-containing protein [Verrucomicrobiae bacterium]